MKRIKQTILLGGLAMLAFSAVASASASATTLSFKYTGTGVNKAKFSGRGGETYFEEKSGGLWECRSSTTSGEVNGASGSAKLTGVFVTFSECKVGAKVCTSAGQAAGVMKTSELEGELGQSGEGDLLLKPKSGGTFMACKAPQYYEFEGGLIGHISPVDRAVGTKSQFTLSYNQTKGVQELTKFPGGSEDFLQESWAGTAYESAGVDGNVGIQPLEGEMEIVETA
jgi:hypothetical protein